MVVRDDVPDPEPEFGQVLVQVKACGICGSDLHFAKHGATMLALGEEMEGMPDMGARAELDLGRDVFMGHEFSAEVLEVGPDTVGPKPGTLVTSIPAMLTHDRRASDLVYSNDLPAGYGERMLLSAPMLARGAERPRRRPRRAHRADGGRSARRQPLGHRAGQGALVLGCGPVGLAVIAALQPARHRRRSSPPTSPRPAGRWPSTMGAHEVVDPADGAGLRRVDARRRRHGRSWCSRRSACPASSTSALAVGAAAAPASSSSACAWSATRSRRSSAIGKELNLQFVPRLRPDGVRRRACARSPRARSTSTPMITGEVGLDGVPDAFDALADPDEHCKILVTP